MPRDQTRSLFDDGEGCPRRGVAGRAAGRSDAAAGPRRSSSARAIWSARAGWCGG